MRRVGLALYLLATSRRNVATALEKLQARPQRPEGQLLWLHVPDSAHGPSAAVLIHRLSEERPELAILLTGPGAAHIVAQAGADPTALVIAQPAPSETLTEIVQFLDHWRPDLVLQIGGPLAPGLFNQIHRERLPLYLVEADLKLAGALRWLPGLAPSLLQPCRLILTPSREATRSLRRVAGGGLAIETSGPLESGSAALACTEAERETLAAQMKTRPAWFAAAVPDEEIGAVLAAHRHALRFAHRLLLILVPERPETGAALAARIGAEHGWEVAVRSADQEFDEDCQVYLADTEGEFGLWYRLAPITYMGGSLSSGGSRRSPLEAAALGSAVVHGPRTGSLAGAYQALAAAGAARRVHDDGELCRALADLLAPDRAAQLAHNAWQVISAGAEVTDRVVSILVSALAESEAA